jgi:hypothetical protein
MKTYIIDPSSTEWNRGSFCYLPYLFYDFLTNERKEEVQFLENFTIPEIHKIEPNSTIYVAFWSPTQKNICLELHRNFPNALFFGYYGFIEEYGFPKRIISQEEIFSGIKYQGRNFDTFKTVLLSDCDSHIKGEFKGQWYPFHTSYGCPKGCSFCPSSKNNNKQWLGLSKEEIKEKLQYFKSKGYTNLHFTDEDLFLNKFRAYSILNFCEEIGGFNLIALTHSHSMISFTDTFGTDILYASGVRLLEVGFEGMNLLHEKGKHHLKECLELYQRCKGLVYWLTMTFAPGETIESLYATGQFLKQYGKKPEELLPRLRTNGTEGGLGQFYQPYPNISSPEEGIYSPFDYVRLFPSFIPASFLNQKININTDRVLEFNVWCKLYNVEKYINTMLKNADRTIYSVVEEYDTYIQQAEFCIAVALAARLGVVR